jgi:hypothetical protein
MAYKPPKNLPELKQQTANQPKIITPAPAETHNIPTSCTKQKAEWFLLFA